MLTDQDIQRIAEAYKKFLPAKENAKSAFEELGRDILKLKNILDQIEESLIIKR